MLYYFLLFIGIIVIYFLIDNDDFDDRDLE